MPTTKTTQPTATDQLLYPQPDDHPSSLFWLAHYFRVFKKLQAVEDLSKKQMKEWSPRKSYVVHALLHAEELLNEQVQNHATYVTKHGLLLFAHQDTTIFNNPMASEVAA